ncbi:hypothetical protein DENSPDRAFT_885884 [Dentipellis sp. KUC8613]|nr:hypothetical protein DENSPDRAFT_885884 [Dentipellis sp. KUC8613]
MSELDADLYGDLYGTEETEFTGGKDSITEEAQAPTSPAAESSAPPKPATTPVVKEKEEPKPIPSLASTPAPAPSATAAANPQPSTSAAPQPPTPVTQQIPTYQENHEESYVVQTMPYGQQQGGYSPAAAGQERSVRPSEMKDEG